MMEKASYRLVMLKRDIPASTVKSIVRTIRISTVLTIVDSHASEGGSKIMIHSRP